MLWSAALCSGGVSLAHAALRDRGDLVTCHSLGEIENVPFVGLTCADYDYAT